MITAIVRYKLPATIGKNECLAHFHKIAPGFAKEKGFIRKQFIWSENGIAGGVYQWETLADLAIGLCCVRPLDARSCGRRGVVRTT